MFPPVSITRIWRKFSACLTMALPLFAVMPAARAACVPPMGSYVGTGAGPAIVPLDDGKGGKTLTSGLLRQTVFLKWAGNSGEIQSRSVFTANPADNSSKSLTWLGVGRARTTATNIFGQGGGGGGENVPLAVWPLNMTSCTGVMQATGIGIGGDTQVWTVLSTENGKVVTLAPYSPDPSKPELGFSIRLERL